MTGAQIDDPYKGLAASITQRAIDDCKGKIESTVGSDLVKGLIQYEATQWLKSDPWCDALLCCLPPEYQGVSQEEITKRTIKKRKKSYLKYLPKEIDIDDWMPIAYLAKLTGIDRHRMYAAISRDDLYAIQEENGYWYSTLEEVAITLVAGGLKIT